MFSANIKVKSKVLKNVKMSKSQNKYDCQNFEKMVNTKCQIKSFIKCQSRYKCQNVK